jgi:peptidoglycan/LPS O-acetylase OafA/YrhL
MKNNFDALRLIAALAVLFSHMAPLSGREEWVWEGHSAGGIGVLVFFSISGFLITASLKADPDLGRFLAKRYLRMFPGLVVALAVSYLLVRAFGQWGFSANPHPGHFNNSLWTIPYEVYCYLLLAALGTRKRPALILGAGMLLAYALLPLYYLIFFGLFFAAGGLLQEYPNFRAWQPVGLFALAGVGMYLLTGNAVMALLLVVPGLTVWIGTKSWPVLRSAGRFGDLSYGVYIYAWPMQQLVVALMPRGSSYYLLAAVSVAVVLPLAWLSWRFVEAPALAKKPKSPPRYPASCEAAGSAPSIPSSASLPERASAPVSG